MSSCVFKTFLILSLIFFISEAKEAVFIIIIGGIVSSSSFIVSLNIKELVCSGKSFFKCLCRVFNVTVIQLLLRIL